MQSADRQVAGVEPTLFRKCWTSVADPIRPSDCRDGQRKTERRETIAASLAERPGLAGADHLGLRTGV
jgi:hypothetical protein